MLQLGEITHYSNFAKNQPTSVFRESNGHNGTLCNPDDLRSRSSLNLVAGEKSLLKSGGPMCKLARVVSELVYA